MEKNIKKLVEKLVENPDTIKDECMEVEVHPKLFK
jgi:hypothetical protein